MKTIRTAIIGGTGLESLLPEGTKTRVGTPYGPTPPITLARIGGREVAFLPRHGERHTHAPHRINYRANIWALHTLGVERVLATSAVGGINVEYSPGDLVIPDDFIDFTKHRALTFYDEAPVTHIDMTEAYCPELRRILIEAAKERRAGVWERGVYACTEGPRFETPAEIRMLRALGCDVVGMTGFPEVVLAREVETCYATLCYVS
ncbi:MAG: S-methyl-5'-thioinosine phosphorylase, partial [Candidatus Bathyarchaeia archaeon]